jgi:hypothetical protein
VGTFRWWAGGHDDEVCRVRRVLFALGGLLVPTLALAAPPCATHGKAKACREFDGTVAITLEDGSVRRVPAKHLPELPPLPDPFALDVTPDEVATADPVVIDIGIIATTDVVATLGSFDAFAAFAQLEIDTANQTIANTQIPNLTLRLAGVGPWNHASSPGCGTDLNAAVIDSAVGAWRNSVGADLVSGLSQCSDACGIGYITASAPIAFTMVALNCAVGNLSFPHEIGHNEGMNHDRGSSNAGEAYPYSFGFIAPDCSFRDVMSYPGCAPRLNHYSSPRVVINGQPGRHGDTRTTT